MVWVECKELTVQPNGMLVLPSYRCRSSTMKQLLFI